MFRRPLMLAGGLLALALLVGAPTQGHARPLDLGLAKQMKNAPRQITMSVRRANWYRPGFHRGFYYGPHSGIHYSPRYGFHYGPHIGGYRGLHSGFYGGSAYPYYGGGLGYPYYGGGLGYPYYGGIGYPYYSGYGFPYFSRGIYFGF